MREPNRMVPTELLRQLRAGQLEEVDGPAALQAVRAIDRAVGLEVEPARWGITVRPDGGVEWWAVAGQLYWVLRRVPDLEGSHLAELRTDGRRTWWAVVSGAGL